jgi:hypothetical protein
MPKVSVPEPLGSPEHLPPIKFDPVMKFQSAPLQEAFDYWDAIRGGRIMPTRAELLPRDMKRFISHVGMIEPMSKKTGVQDYFVRLAGSHVEEIFGPRTGRPLGEGVPPEIVARWRIGYDMVQRSAKPVKATARVAYKGKNWIEVEVLVAPLGEDSTPSSFFLVVSKLKPKPSSHD